MKRHAKASSAGPSMGQDSRLGRIVRGAFATRGASSDVKGASAPRTSLAFIASAAVLIALALPVAASAAPPTLTIDAVSSSSVTTAHVSGTVSVPARSAGGHETAWCFEYAEEGKGNWSSFCYAGSLQFGETASVESDLNGLKAGTPYEVRLAAVDNLEFFEGSEVVSSGSNPTFTTDPATVPTVTLDPSGTASYTSIHVSGSIDPEGGTVDSQLGLLAIAWEFQVSREGGDWETRASGEISSAEPEGGGTPPAAGDDPVNLEADLTGLATGSNYKVRLHVAYAGLIADSSEDEFTTLAVTKPTAEDIDVTDVTSSTAHFEATLHTNAPGVSLDDPTKVAYAAHWSFSPGQSEGDTEAETLTKTVEGEASGLEPHHQYTVTFTVSNAAGSNEISVPFETDAVKPEIEAAPLFSPTQTSAQLNAALNPHNSPISECRFTYGTASPSEHEAACEGINEMQALTVSAQAGQFKLSFEGQKTADLAFDASAGGVRAALQALPGIGAGNVSVSGGPGDKEGTKPYQITFGGSLAFQDVEQITVEDGTVPLSGEGTPGVSVLTQTQGASGIGAINTSPGNAFRNVAARIAGFSPGTKYQYRLIATNPVGTTEGDIHSFTTPAEAGSEECANEAIREHQESTHLPECRAWEKVSPAEKGHSDIIGDGGTNVASKDGDAVTLSSRTPFGDTIGSGVSGQTQYVARRGTDGWSLHAITPQPRSDAFQTSFGATRYQAFSDDLRSAVLFGDDFPAVSGDLPLRNNLYVEDTASRALQPVTALQPGGLPETSTLLVPNFEFANDAQWGISADARHVSFVSRGNFLPQAAPSAPNLYQWDEGVLSLAGLLPDGAVPPGGSGAASSQYTLYRDAMSDDGSRQLFTASPEAGAPKQLYQRIDGTHTAWISEPEGDDTSFPEGVRLMAATPDGRNVFFTTTSKLLNADEHEGADLYRWSDTPDPATEDNLTLITENGFDDQAQVIGASDDGERVYYQTASNQLVAWDDGATRIINSSVPIPGGADVQLGVATAGPGLGRVTPDGRYLAFATDFTNSNASGSLVGPTGNVTNGRTEMYLYDYENNTLKCVSCPAGPPVGPLTLTDGDQGIVTPTATTGVVTYTMPGIRPHFLADDGKVFFSSTEALVPQDTNGVLDTYQYDPATGELSLLGSGTSKEPTSFAAASPSGDDVFIVTRAQLVGSDTDNLVDLYDVRSGGGFAEPLAPPPAPCSGEGCQGAAAGAPALGAPASQAEGRGNVKPSGPSCSKPRGKAARGGKAKRCTKHKRAHHKRAAKTNRRAAK